jgi:two-component system NtrC family sensor kinase
MAHPTGELHIVSEQQPEIEPRINVVILGAGKGGTALLESFLNLPRIHVIGIAEKERKAPGLKLARRHSIPTTQDAMELIQLPDIHLIVDVTGDPSLSNTIHGHKHEGTEVLGGAGSKVLWDIIRHESLMQTQLFQAEKLAGMGTFASGIAHDINNPLYIILAMAEAIQDESDIATIHQHVTSIQEATKRIHTISRNITQYARVSNSQESFPVPVEDTLQEALKIAKFATKFHEMTVIQNYHDHVTIDAKPEELLQVFVNLMINAVHAMEKHGLLTLTAEKHNGVVRVTISDTGKGISAEHLPKIFDPFFTTKPPGEGTGLGLYNVRTIVRKYQGDLTVESKLGKGTTFSLVFPPGDPSYT